MSELKGSAHGSSLSWGNKTSFILIPVHCRKCMHPLKHVRSMKEIMDQKKQSHESQAIKNINHCITSLLGLKVANWCFHRVLCNTSLLISNIMGPSEEMFIGNNLVTYVRANISSLPHAIVIHMTSYAGNADLQLMVAEDIIHEPEVLRMCFQKSFLEMRKDFQQA